MLVFNNLFYSVDLRHMFMSKIRLVMGMHWGTTYCIYACKYSKYQI